MRKVFIVIEDAAETSIVIAVTSDEAVAEASVEAIDAEAEDGESGAFYTEAEIVESVQELLGARDRVWNAYLADVEEGVGDEMADD